MLPLEASTDVDWKEGDLSVMSMAVVGQKGGAPNGHLTYRGKGPERDPNLLFFTDGYLTHGAGVG